jgi:hypothetical protein
MKFHANSAAKIRHKTDALTLIARMALPRFGPRDATKIAANSGPTIKPSSK